MTLKTQINMNNKGKCVSPQAGRVVYTTSVVGYAPGSISSGESGTGARPDEKLLEEITAILSAK